MSAELKKAVGRACLKPQFPYMPAEEWSAHIAEARALMDDSGLDALMMLNNQDRLYFFGASKTYRNAYPGAGVVPRRGATTMVMGPGDSLVLEMEAYADWNVGYRGYTQAPTATAPRISL